MNLEGLLGNAQPLNPSSLPSQKTIITHTYNMISAFYDNKDICNETLYDMKRTVAVNEEEARFLSEFYDTIITSQVSLKSNCSDEYKKDEKFSEKITDFSFQHLIMLLFGNPQFQKLFPEAKEVKPDVFANHIPFDYQQKVVKDFGKLNNWLLKGSNSLCLEQDKLGE